MRGRGRCVSGQVGTTFSHDHSMARLMNAHACRDIQKGQTDRGRDVPTHRQVNEMK